MILSDLGKKAVKLTIDNSPAILTAIGVAGAITTAYLSGTASFKAARMIREFEEDNTVQRDLTWQDDVKLVWKEYIPAVGTGVLTVVCIIGANRIGTRRAAALAAAYSLSERAFSEYKEKVVEIAGKNKEQKIRDEVAQDKVNQTPALSTFLVGEGKVLCLDAYTGRPFENTMEGIRRAQNDINAQILNRIGNSASLSDFYNEIGLPETSMSDEVGWNTDNMLEVDFSTAITEDQKPCLVVSFQVSPVRGYDRLR